MTDSQLFAEQFDKDCWDNWRTLLKGFYALDMSDEERKVYHELTQRNDVHDDAFRELWLVIGRRGDKSQIAALIAIYEAFFVDHQHQLSGAKLRLLCLSPPTVNKQDRYFVTLKA